MLASLNGLTLSILGLASGQANLDLQPAIGSLANLDRLPQIKLAADLLDSTLSLDLHSNLNTLNGLDLALLLKPGLSA